MAQKLRESTIYPGMSNFQFPSLHGNADFSIDTVKASIKQAKSKTNHITKKYHSSEDFVKVADTKDIQSSYMKEFQVDGENICVVNVEGKYYAISNICSHESGPLADGLKALK